MSAYDKLNNKRKGEIMIKVIEQINKTNRNVWEFFYYQNNHNYLILDSYRKENLENGKWNTSGMWDSMDKDNIFNTLTMPQLTEVIKQRAISEFTKTINVRF